MTLFNQSYHLRSFANWLVLAPVVYVFALMWWIPEGDKYVPGIVVVALLILGAGRRLVVAPERQISPLQPFIKLLWLYVAYSAVIYLVHGGSWSELRAFLCLALYLQFTKGLILPESWRNGLLTTSALALTILVFSEYMQHGGRVGGNVNPIPFATVVGILFLVLYAMVLFAYRPVALKIVVWALVLALMASLMMTQTRGVLLPALGLFIALFVWVSIKRPGLRFRRKYMALTVVLFVVGSSLAVLSSDRIEQTISEVEAIKSGDLSTSIGIRLQLWSAAIPLVADAPLIGHGEHYRDALEGLYYQGELSSELYRFNAAHFHNQFLDTWVKKGTMGLFLLIALLAAAVKSLWCSDLELWCRVGGLSIVLLLAVSALTDVPLIHVPVIFYVGFMFFVLSAGRQRYVRQGEG